MEDARATLKPVGQHSPDQHTHDLHSPDLRSPDLHSHDHPIPHEDRKTWIFTLYAICGILVFGVAAYFTSIYFAK